MIWPYGAQAAAMVSVELDNEFIWNALSEKVNYDYSTPKNQSMGTYGSLRGLDRMLDSLCRFHTKVTFFVPGMFAERYPMLVKKVADEGHELAVHGHSHRDFSLLSGEEQRGELEQAILAIQQITGTRPVGFRLPEGSSTPETLGILHDMGMLYDSSLFHHDIPFQLELEGTPISMAEIPMRWELQDFPYFAFGPGFPIGGGRIAIYDDVLENWLCELDADYDLGYCYVIKFDPQTIGSPGRMFLFDRVLQAIAQRNIWCATGTDIARHTLMQ